MNIAYINLNLITTQSYVQNLLGYLTKKYILIDKIDFFKTSDIIDCSNDSKPSKNCNLETYDLVIFEIDNLDNNGSLILNKLNFESKQNKTLIIVSDNTIADKVSQIGVDINRCGLLNINSDCVDLSSTLNRINLFNSCLYINKYLNIKLFIDRIVYIRLLHNGEVEIKYNSYSDKSKYSLKMINYIVNRYDNLIKLKSGYIVNIEKIVKIENFKLVMTDMSHIPLTKSCFYDNLFILEVEK